MADANEVNIKLNVDEEENQQVSQKDAPPSAGMDSVYIDKNPPSLQQMRNTEWRPEWDDVGTGLSNEVQRQRKKTYGPNALPEKHTSPIMDYLKNYWGPMPIMIWVAIIILGLKNLTPKKAWPDFIMCILLQLVNANVKWYIGRKSKNAIAALKAQMAQCSIAKRDGEWQTVQAEDLVPGDIIQISIGNILPADCMCGPSENVQVDQAALTGESLPKSVDPGGRLLASSVVKRGEGEALVCCTGSLTVMGKTASMVAGVKKRSRYDSILYFVAIYLMSLAFTCMSILFVFMMTRDPPENLLFALGVVVTILVGALPVAMHVVCMVIMAMGAYRLSQENAVVTELTATEELSGMSILCSDKTGTLTLNQLEINTKDTVTFGVPQNDLLFCAALSCKRSESGQDAIDHCITQAVKLDDELWAKVQKHPTTKFTPFDPIIKRTEAIIQGPDGETFRVAKGAPQVMLELAENKEECRKQALSVIDKLARRGFRTIGISRGTSDGKWTLLGMLAISDPPRHDTAHVIKTAQAMGIKVIMITGDQTAIAREVGRQTGIGTNILSSRFITDYDNGKLPKELADRAADIIEFSDGFAEVLPEHKYRIVEILQSRGYIVGMTGDGVNDAPALKRANVGIAVQGATDAARAAASMFLKEEGLGVIITAIRRSKKVFERVKNYIIYRSATSLRLMGFFFVGALFISPLNFLPAYDDHPSNFRVFCHPRDQDNVAVTLDYTLDENNDSAPGQFSKHSTCLRTPTDLLECMEGHDWDHTKMASCASDIWKNNTRPLSALRWHETDFQGSGSGSAFQPKAGCLDGTDTVINAVSTISGNFERPLAAKGPFFGGIGSLLWETECLTTAGQGKLIRSIMADWQEISNEAESKSSASTGNTARDLVESLYRLIRSEIYISNYFQPPALVIIVLTLLNDFTVITIAFDHVQISNTPDKWWLWRNILLGTIIGANTLVWSIVMFVFMLNTMDPRFWACRDFGLCLEYPEILTGTFLQLSLCARLARTNARKNDWFCTLGLNRSVVMTMTFSIVMAGLLSFTWPLCPSKGDCSPRMVPLNPIMCAIIILYQIPVHVFRDCCKMVTYKFFVRLDKKSINTLLEERMRVRDECLGLLMKHNLCGDPDDMVSPELSVNLSHSESIKFGIVSNADDGPCLPFMPRHCGPKLFYWNGGGSGCGCNPVAYFLLFLVVGIVTLLIYA